MITRSRTRAAKNQEPTVAPESRLTSISKGFVEDESGEDDEQEEESLSIVIHYGVYLIDDRGDDAEGSW